MADPVPSLWAEVVGQPAATTILRRAVDRDDVPHALLFVGPIGVGQREATRALAADLNCPEGWPHCGRCSTCRRIGDDQHPAVHHFERQGASHLVDDVREEWLPVATRTLVEGRRKVLRIADAGRTNEAAQNAFLKILEEPPASVTWILETEDPDDLLDTVVSRCRRIDFTLWRPDHLADLAASIGLPDDRRIPLVRAAMGRPDRLRQLADPAVGTARDRHLRLVRELAEAGPGSVARIASEVVAWTRTRQEAAKHEHAEEMERLEASFGDQWPPGVRARIAKRNERREREARTQALRLVLDDLASYLRDLLVVGAGGGEDAVVNVDHLGQLADDAGRVPLALVLEWLDAVAETAEAIEMNGQPELQLERLLLRLAVGLYAPA